MKNIILFGECGAGKSTVAKIISDLYGYKIMSLGEEIHKTCRLYGKETREQLQQFGQAMRTIFSENIWCDYLYNKTLETDKNIIVDDGRQLNEYNFFSAKGYIPIGVKADDNLRIERLKKRVNYEVDEKTFQHDTEVQARENVKRCDIVIVNNGNLEDLTEQIKEKLNLNIIQPKELTYLDQVKIIKIINPSRVKYMESLVGKTGIIKSWIVKNGEKKYKVIINDSLDESYYFYTGELELIS